MSVQICVVEPSELDVVCIQTTTGGQLPPEQEGDSIGAGRNASIAGGIAGIVGWVLFVVAFALAPTPPTLGAAAAHIVQYSAAHHGAMLLAAFLFGATAPFLLIWAGALAARLRDAEGQRAWLYLVFLAGASVTMAVDVSTSFVWMALSGRGWTAGEAIAQTLSDIVNYGYIFTGFGSATFVGAAAVVMMRTGEVARALGTIGLAISAIQVVYLFTAFFTDGFMVGGGAVTIAGFTVLGLWLLAVSIMMIVRTPASVKTA